MGLFDRKKKPKDIITPLPPPPSSSSHHQPALPPPPSHQQQPTRSLLQQHHQSFVPTSTSRPRSRQLAGPPQQTTTTRVRTGSDPSVGRPAVGERWTAPAAAAAPPPPPSTMDGLASSRQDVLDPRRRAGSGGPRDGSNWQSDDWSMVPHPSPSPQLASSPTPAAATTSSSPAPTPTPPSSDPQAAAAAVRSSLLLQATSPLDALSSASLNPIRAAGLPLRAHHPPQHHPHPPTHRHPQHPVHSGSQSSISTIGTQPSERSHAGPGQAVGGRDRADSAPLPTIPSPASGTAVGGWEFVTQPLLQQQQQQQQQRSYAPPPTSAPLSHHPQQQQQYPQPMHRYPTPHVLPPPLPPPPPSINHSQHQPQQQQQQPDIVVSTPRDGGAGAASPKKGRKLGAFLSSLSAGAVGRDKASSGVDDDGSVGAPAPRASFDGRQDEVEAEVPGGGGGGGGAAGQDDVEALVGVLCSLPPYVLQSDSERAVFQTGMQDVKWRLAHPPSSSTAPSSGGGALVIAAGPASTVAGRGGSGGGAGAEDGPKLAERLGRRVRHELKSLPAEVKKAEKEREKGEPASADGGRRLGGGIAAVWWWLMLWSEDATVLRVCSTAKFTSLVETAIRKLPARAEQRKELYHVLADLADRFRGHEGSEDLEKSHARVWEAEKGLGIVQEPPPAYISEYREGRSSRSSARSSPFVPPPGHHSHHHHHRQQQQQQHAVTAPKQQVPYPAQPFVSPPPVVLSDRSAASWHHSQPPFHPQQQQQQQQQQAPPPPQAYDLVPTGFQVNALPSVHDDLLRLEEECLGAIRSAKRLTGAADEVGGLQRMGVDVDDETMSSFKASYESCVRIQAELVNHLPWAESTAEQSLVTPTAAAGGGLPPINGHGAPGADDGETKAQEVLRLLVDATGQVAEALERVHVLEREKQEAEELALVSERSRKETRHDRSQPIDSHLGVPRTGGGGGGSRSPSPTPRALWDDGASHRSGGQTLGPVGGLSGGKSPSVYSANLRSPATPDHGSPLPPAPRGPNDPARLAPSPGSRPLPVPGGQAQATASAGEASDDESVALSQPSAKAMGKRRVIEAFEADEAFDPDDIYKTADDDRTLQRQDSLPSSEADPELQDGWVPPKPVVYIYDAAEEHKKEREQERVREALRAHRLANGLGSSAFAGDAAADGDGALPPPPPPPPPPTSHLVQDNLPPPSKRVPQGLSQEREMARLLGAAAGSRTPPLHNGADDKEGAGAALGRKLSFWKKGSHIPGHRSASRETG